MSEKYEPNFGVFKILRVPPGNNVASICESEERSTNLRWNLKSISANDFSLLNRQTSISYADGNFFCPRPDNCDG